MKATSRIVALSLAIGVRVLLAQTALSDEAIQAAINNGRQSTFQKVWKRIEKHRTVKVNGYSIGGDTVAKKVVFLTDVDAIAVAAADAHRRHQDITVEIVKSWPDLGSVRVLLTVEASGMYKMNLPKWQAPAVHMTITADGVEAQPLSESATTRKDTTIGATQHGVVTNNGGIVSYTPTYQSAIYDVARSKTWFSFRINPEAKNLKITVISSDGHEKSKEFDSSVLR